MNRSSTGIRAKARGAVRLVVLLVVALTVVLLAVFLPGLGPGGSPASALPQPPPDASRGYDVLSYDISLEMDPASKSFTGRVWMTARMTERRDWLQIDAASATLTVDTSAGTRVLWHRGDTLALGPEGPLEAGDTVETDVRFSGVSDFDGRYDGGGVLFTPASEASPGVKIATISQPFFARRWWPCNDTPGDKAVVSMTVTVPEGMTAVSNGKLQGKTTAGERTRFVWKSSYPIAPYLVSVAAASYDVAYDTMLIDAPRPPGAGGTVRDPGAMQVVVGLYTYAYPADKERAREDFARTKLILRTLGGLFGPYPFAFDKYATVEVDGQLTMENQSAVSFQRNLITGDRRNESVLVHEIAHQWWGNLVGPASWDHLWLNEGTATYAEALFLEATSGAEAYARRIASLMERPDTFYLGSVVGQDDEDFWELFSPRTYDKAAIVLHMLRRQIGDEAFFMGVRSYFDDPALRYGTAVTEDFARHMERAAGVDLDWFFTQWMTTPAAGSDRPRLEYSWSWDGAGQVRVDVAQVQPGGFVYRLPLDIVAAGSGGAVTASVVDTLQTQSFVLAASARPDTVILDPDRKLFMDARPTAPKR